MDICVAKRRSSCWMFLRTSQAQISDRTLLTQWRTRYNVDVLLRGGPCECHAHGGRATGTRSYCDAKGHHLLSCPKGRWRTAWHDTTVRINVRDCNVMGIEAVEEPRYDKDGRPIERSQRRGDVRVSSDPTERNGIAYLDHVCSNPLVKTNLETVRSRGIIGVHADAEKRKRDEFPPHLRDRANIIPLSFATVGDTVGEGAATWFSTLDKCARARSGGALPRGRVPTRLLCRLAIMDAYGCMVEAKNRQLALRGDATGPDRTVADTGRAIDATTRARGRALRASCHGRCTRGTSSSEAPPRGGRQRILCIR